MRSIRFVHISDTHIPGENATAEYLKILTEQGEAPADNLRKALAYIAQTFGALDFMLVTGDLTHDGREPEYALLKEIFEENVSCPIFPALGNHDDAASFRQGYLGKKGGSAPYYLAQTVDGLRIVTLDTSLPGREYGHLGSEQLSWLANTLHRPADKGSLLILHHPPTIESKEGMLRTGLANPTELLDAIKGSDVRAIFSGHTHKGSSLTFGGIPHYNAGSTAFGVSFGEGYLHITASRSFCYCVMQASEIYIEPNALTASHKIFYQMPLKQGHTSQGG